MSDRDWENEDSNDDEVTVKTGIPLPCFVVFINERVVYWCAPCETVARELTWWDGDNICRAWEVGTGVVCVRHGLEHVEWVGIVKDWKALGAFMITGQLPDEEAGQLPN